MAACERMVQINVEDIIRNEAACDEWIWKVVDRHRKIIKIKSLVHIELLLLNFLGSSSLGAKHAYIKFTIV